MKYVHRFIPGFILSVVVFSQGCGVLTIEVVHEDVELGEIEFDDLFEELSSSIDGTLKDVDRERTALRFSFGPREKSQGYVQVITEEFADLDRGFGVGGGYIGQPVLKTFSNDSALFADIRFGVNATYIQDDDTTDEDAVFLEAQLRGGVGVDVYGVRPGVGFALDSLFGVIDESAITGINPAGYAQVGYLSDEVPVLAQFRVYFGDIEGIEFQIGVQF